MPSGVCFGQVGCPPDGWVPLVRSPRSATASPAALERHCISPSPPSLGSLPAPPRTPSPTRPSPPRPRPPRPPARRGTAPLGLTGTLPAPTSLDTGGKGPGVSWTPRPGSQAQAAAQGRSSPVTRRGVVHSARVNWRRSLTKRTTRRREPRSPPDLRPASEQSPSLRTATAAAVAATR